MEQATALQKYRADNKMTLEALGQKFGADKSTMLRWEKCVPLARVIDVERVTGISRHELREDIFGPAKPTQVEAA